MHFIKFVFDLAFLFICFDLLWNILMFLFKQVMGIDRKRNSTAYYLLKGISLYILTSLTIVVTFNNVGQHDGPLNHISYPLIGLIVLYLYITSGMQKSRLKAQITMDQQSKRRLRFNSFFLSSAILYYGVGIILSARNQEQFTSWIVENEIVTLFFATINDIYDLLLLRVIIGFLAILLMFNMAVRGLMTTRLLLFNFFGIPDRARQRMNQRFNRDQPEPSSGQAQHHEDEAGYTDYEIIDEEDNDDKNKDKE